MLARESLRIRERIHTLHTNYSHQITASTSVLYGILLQRGKLGDETKELHERTLRGDIRNEEPNAISC
jgi:hypothetical protein